MRFLITNYDLTRRGGTQLFVRDLAVRLLEQQHEPIVYSPYLGAIASELRGWTIPVTSDLRSIAAAPDIIIGNDHLGAMSALHRFPGTPAIYFVHGPQTLLPKFPRIRRYVAVDETCRSHLLFTHGVGEEQVEVILNAVDLSRFLPRDSLPPRPRRAALFGNQFQDNEQLRAIRTACRDAGIEVDIVGYSLGKSVANPEKALLEYDLVFARARCALEAMATGAAVILTGRTRMGGMVMPAELERFRHLNFGRRTLMTPIDADSVRREISRYDAAGALEVCRRIRETASLDASVDQIVRLAGDVVDEQRESTIDVAAEYDATAAYLRALEPEVNRLENLWMRIGRLPLVGGIASRLAIFISRSFER